MHKKILVAAGLYPPDIGGPATYARMIEEELPKHGFEVSVMPFGTVRHLPKGIRHIVYAWRLYKKASEYDAVYALDSISVGIPAVVVSRLRHKQLLIRLGGDYAWEQGRQRFGVTDSLDEYTDARARQGYRVRVLASVQDWVVRHAHAVIVPSKYLKSIVCTWSGVKAELVHVVYSALFPLQPKQTVEEIRSQLAYTGTVLVSAGRIVPWKGFDVLVETVVSLHKKDASISLVIAGGGPGEKRLREKVRMLDAESYIRMVGCLTKDALASVVRGADMFVLHTGYEGLSHQLLEVMDLGLPVITTDVGGNPELITDGVSGLLIPYNDAEALEKAITHLVAHVDTRERYAQNARLRVVDFEKKKVLTSLIDILSKHV